MDGDVIIQVTDDTVTLNVNNGLPLGGDTGQMLVKSTNVSYEAQWVDAPTGTVTQVIAGTGLTGGTITASGTIAVDFAASGAATPNKVVEATDSRMSNARTPTSHAASHAAAGSDPVSIDIAQVNTLTATLAGKVSVSTTVSAGTGLTGGGDLSANRTIAANFGSTAGTICQGNDARLTNSRTPTAHGATHGTAGTDPIPAGGLSQLQVANLTTDLAAKVPDSRLVSTGSGLLGGGDLTTNRTLSVDFAPDGGSSPTQAVKASDSRMSNARTPTSHGSTHGSAGSDPIPAGGLSQSQVANLTSDLALKVPTSRTITAGTGLTGGGDLSANRTLTVDFAPSGSGTGSQAVSATDSRLTDSRSPSGVAGGHLSGTYPSPDIADAVVTVAKISATGSPTATTYFCGDGSWSPITVSKITATGTPSLTTYLCGDGTWSVPQAAGTAGGDLSGTYPNPTLAFKPMLSLGTDLGAWKMITTVDNTDAVLPGSGSTQWAYILFRVKTSNNQFEIINCAVAAGGVTIGSALVGYHYHALIWRVT